MIRIFKKIVYNSREYTTLTDEYELLYLIYHGGMSGWHRLKWLIDIVDYININSIDKQEFLNLISNYKINKLIMDLKFIFDEVFIRR